MKNAISELKFYKSKSIMIISHTIGVNYGVANNYCEFKFASRPDAQSAGNWNDDNRFFLTGYTSLYNFVRELDKVLKNKKEKHVEKNPQKKTNLLIRTSVGDDGQRWVTFHFYRGDDVKISVSLNYEKEFLSLYKYLMGIIENYHVIAAIALFRQDYYFINFNKNKNGNKKNNAPSLDDEPPKENKKSGDNNNMDDIDNLLEDMPALDDDDIPF